MLPPPWWIFNLLSTHYISHMKSGEKLIFKRLTRLTISRDEKLVDLWHRFCIWKTPVDNAINVSLACKCKSVKTGLFLKPYVAASVVKFNMRMLVFTFKHNEYSWKAWKYRIWQAYVATNDFKNWPVLQALVNTDLFETLATGQCRGSNPRPSNPRSSITEVSIWLSTTFRLTTLVPSQAASTQ